MSSHGQEDSASPQLDTFLILTFQQENILKTVEIISKSSKAIVEAINHKSISSAGQFQAFGTMVTARLEPMASHKAEKAMAAISEQLFS